MTPHTASREHALEYLHHRLLVGTRIVLIDGPSGSGKSTLAAELHDRATVDGTAVDLLHLDDIYPGWKGLQAGAREVADMVVVPLASGRPGFCLRYDWNTGTKNQRLHFHPDRALIIEGVGALHPTSAPLASGRVWLTAATPQRRARAFARDGDSYRPHWHLWAAQEAAYVGETLPEARADLIVDTTSEGKAAS